MVQVSLASQETPVTISRWNSQRFLPSVCLQDTHKSEKDPPEWKVLPALLEFFTWISSVHPQDSVNMPWRKLYLQQVSNNVWLNDKVIITYPTIIKWHICKNTEKKNYRYFFFTVKGRVDITTRKLDKIHETNFGPWTSGSTEIRKTDEMRANTAQLTSWKQLLGTSTGGVYQNCLTVGLRWNLEMCGPLDKKGEMWAKREKGGQGGSMRRVEIQGET